MAEEIISPMAGKVIQVKIEVGSQIEEDDEAIVLESMKMETMIFSPCKGTVKEIMVKAGDRVDEDQVLAVIET